MTDNPDVQAHASEAVAKALAAAADAMAGVAHARSASNVEGRTVKDADRSTTTTQGSTKHDSDINAEEAWAANLKRTYDLTQSWDFELARRSAAHFDAMMADTRSHIANVRKIELETLQNGSHGANLVNTQSTAHRDIATDRIWNVDEVATLTAKSGVQADAMIAALAAAVARELSAKADG